MHVLCFCEQATPQIGSLAARSFHSLVSAPLVMSSVRMPGRFDDDFEHQAEAVVDELQHPMPSMAERPVQYTQVMAAHLQPARAGEVDAPRRP